MSQKITYIVNHYPKGSHSFIRREILALERQGLSVERASIRGWNDDLPDPQDRAEQKLTRYVLRAGMLGLGLRAAAWATARPKRFLAALRVALGMRHGSDRSVLYHLIYLAEACVLADWVVASGSSHIHSHFGTNSAEVAMLAGILAERPYSFTAHGTAETDAPVAIGLAEKIRRAAFVVAVSYFVRSQLYRWVDYAQWRKIRVVRCGLEKAFHENADTTHKAGESRRLVAVGRLSAEKGHMLLLAALREVLDAGADCELVLVGDGEMRGAIEQQITALGLEHNVRITGWVSSEDVRNEILAARALILSSFAEGLPVVLMEAMALRRPVISTHISGIPELVTHAETGWLFPPGDAASMSAAMRACLGASGEELEHIGANAHARVTRLHDIDEEARRLRQLFAKSGAEAPARITHAAHAAQGSQRAR